KYFDQRRFSILTSAAGRAFLAKLPEDECQEIITDALVASGEREALHVEKARVNSWVIEARSKGYSYRDYDSPISGTRAFGIPVMFKGRPIAALAQPSLRAVLSLEHFEEAILPHLRATAKEISQELAIHTKSDF
ncbi:MAG: hypothetical protein OQK35_04785, partial [Alphaproteobacteria bacterium]|nr:hypothetical protein [Alphaproteobacteria bacterium]